MVNFMDEFMPLQVQCVKRTYHKVSCFSSSLLDIDSGRWHCPNKISLHERTCWLCKSLEDEFQLNEDLRKFYFKTCY